MNNVTQTPTQFTAKNELNRVTVCGAAVHEDKPKKQEPEYNEAEAHFALWFAILSGDRFIRGKAICWQLSLGDAANRLQSSAVSNIDQILSCLSKSSPATIAGFRGTSRKLGTAARASRLPYESLRDIARLPLRKQGEIAEKAARLFWSSAQVSGIVRRVLAEAFDGSEEDNRPVLHVNQLQRFYGARFERAVLSIMRGETRLVGTVNFVVRPWLPEVMKRKGGLMALINETSHIRTWSGGVHAGVSGSGQYGVISPSTK